MRYQEIDSLIVTLFIFSVGWSEDNNDDDYGNDDSLFRCECVCVHGPVA